MTAGIAQAAQTQVDPRLALFCGRERREVFSGIIHANQIWMYDPFDEPEIHADARELFARLVRRATCQPRPPSGKSLLLLGEAGSGKTHLIRAFRNEVHADGTGYCGYLQMNTRSENYARYVLSNLIDSLSHPYRSPNQTTGLSRLATGLLDALDMIPMSERQRLREQSLEPQELADLVFRWADEGVEDARFQAIDLDVIRAILYLLSDDMRIRARVLKWLRCEDLADRDRKLLGGLVPRPQEHMPLRTLVGLGRLMAATSNAALVLCADQLEETIDQSANEKETGELFRRVVDTLITLTEVIPTCIVVVACLEDYFKEAPHWLSKAKRDRLERDPEPIRLKSHRTEEEIAAMVGRRLHFLYECNGLFTEPEDASFPFRREHFRLLTGLTTRDVLDYLRLHQERCILAGHWIEPDAAEPPPPPQPPASIALDQLWNDFLKSAASPTLDLESEIAQLLAWSIQALSAEMPDGFHFGAEPDDRFVPVELHGPNNTVEKLLVAVCEKRAQGGGLGKQIGELAKRAGDIPAVILRSSPFPKTASSAVAKQIANLITPIGKGRRVEVQSADYRAMVAFRKFYELHHTKPEFAAWQRRAQPLASLHALQTILALGSLELPLPASARETPSHPPAQRPASPPVVDVRVAAPTPSDPLLIGKLRGAAADPITAQSKELTAHAAFLGGSGSGKTTAALALIEQLLERGIPAVLIDRKGDLARYADPNALHAKDGDPSQAQGRTRLRERIDVALFTPGAAQGRPLTLPIVPGDLAQLPETEREPYCQYAAAALGSMMGYRTKAAEYGKAILGKAIEVLAAVPGGQVTIRGLRQLIEDQDESLVMAIDGGFEARHYKKLAQDLLALSLRRQRLLEGQGEPMDLDMLLGRGSHARHGKTRLSIINTQFLAGNEDVEFWVAQFLSSLGRWVVRNPAPDGDLQAVFLFDEADKYLPAIGQPATKAPMENLLRRARSAGIGLFLATQSPGDFDYKCRDQIRLWLLGRVKEQVAISKLKPMLEAGRVDAAAKLPGQGAGQFYLVREREVAPVQTELSLLSTEQLPEDRILELARLTVERKAR
jgi:GTPase SAR1 family protein